MFCNYCGRELPKDANFCHECGRQTDSRPDHPKTVAPAKTPAPNRDSSKEPWKRPVEARWLPGDAVEGDKVGGQQQKTIIVLCLVAVGIMGTCIFAVSGPDEGIVYLKGRNALNKGVVSFGRANYSVAAEHFEEAIAADPELLDARQYLATAYMSQFIPGSDFEENLELASKALEGFQGVLDHNPTEAQAILAMSSMGSLYFNMKEFDQALEWYGKLLAMGPNNLQALYVKGVIAWTQIYQPRLEVRAMLGMGPEDPGPIKDNEARIELAETNLPIIEYGMKSLETAIKIDPDYDDAMAYLNLLYLERADISETKEEYNEYREKADDWVQHVSNATWWAARAAARGFRATRSSRSRRCPLTKGYSARARSMTSGRIW